MRLAESVAEGGVVDPLLDRLAGAWSGLTDAHRAAVVELAERLTTVREGVAVDD